LKFIEELVDAQRIGEVDCIKMFLFELELVSLDVGVHVQSVGMARWNLVVLFQLVIAVFISDLRMLDSFV
jgi:hypothetical protein